MCSVECGVGSAEFQVCFVSAECWVWSVVCEVRSVENKSCRVEYGVWLEEFEVLGVECELLRIERSVKCEVLKLQCVV